MVFSTTCAKNMGTSKLIAILRRNLQIKEQLWWLKRRRRRRRLETFSWLTVKDIRASLLLVRSASERCVNSVWIIDSGCSNHMTGMKEIFETLDESR